MVNSFLMAVFAGTLTGYLAGIGVGGGSLLILWLTQAANVDQQTSRSINLMFFISTALTVSIFRKKQGKIQPKILLPAAISGCVFGWLFSLLSGHIDVGLLKKLFGVLLIATGIRELFYRPREFR